MYLGDDDIDADYVLEEDLDSEEYREASEKLVDAAYRNITEWRMAVRDQRDVEEVDSLARDAAKTAYVIDRMNAEFFDGYGKMSDAVMEAFNAGNRAWRFVNEAGTQMQYEMKDSEDIDEGEFVLRNGNNVEPLPEEHEGLELYTLPAEFIEQMSGPIRIDSISVDPEASLDDLPEDDFIEF
ncbi:hypothetical protein ACK3SF_04325 [Candidatus Nanosalina sp. VS9-1]|uniref:hypothetical protein n=1 Tax=Candidatus Nanosalina sp. VS9-1 TaxID=3388566 RepID=UPI0039E1D4EF